MASIVEKETGRAEERDQIAGVLVNRLRIAHGAAGRSDGDLRPWATASTAT